jgi:hypothetical protein
VPAYRTTSLNALKVECRELYKDTRTATSRTTATEETIQWPGVWVRQTEPGEWIGTTHLFGQEHTVKATSEENCRRDLGTALNVSDTAWNALQEEIAATVQGSETIDWTQVRKTVDRNLHNTSETTPAQAFDEAYSAAPLPRLIDPNAEALKEVAQFCFAFVIILSVFALFVSAVAIGTVLAAGVVGWGIRVVHNLAA